MNLSQSRFNLGSVIGLLILCIVSFSSCCEEDELTIKELQICTEEPSALDSAECDDDLSTVGVSDNITFSVKVFAAESSSKITSKLYVLENGVYLPVNDLTQEKSLSDFEGKCGVRVADGWKPSSGNVWPEADLKIEVILNSDPPQIISKEVKIRI